jgi:hypothetical protein
MPALTPNSLISLVAVHLATVADIGVIHTRRRAVKDEQAARAVWYSEAQGRIHAWQISLAEPAVNSTRSPGFGPVGSGQSGRVLSDFGISIEGVFGIDDAADSETEFRAVAWAVVMAFNSVGMIDASIVQQGPMQWERFGYVTLASMYTVHYAKLRGSFMGQVLPL